MGKFWMDWTQYAVLSRDQTISGQPSKDVLVVVTISVVPLLLLMFLLLLPLFLPSEMDLVCSRLTRGKDDAKSARKYVERAKKQIVYDSAAAAWSAGVPWSEALEMSSRVMDKVAKAKPKPKAHPKGKGKPKR